MLTLKEYQRRSLEALEEFLRRASVGDPDLEFYKLTRRPYATVPELPHPPYVCLRIPTGGGKTLVACHAVGIAAREYVQADRIVCLWLVPSNAIREQTLIGLQSRAHPYRQALEAALDGPVTVCDIKEALSLAPGVPTTDHVVVVSTLAALRVQDTEGRKIYESSGALLGHFQALMPEEEARLERSDGRVIRSLANVLRLHRPLVVMDEAHNARTPLSFESLKRFDPSCILEFTATPDLENRPDKGHYPSNVLHHVSARELKAEDMVKLPIELHAESDWRAVVGCAVAAQAELEKAAERERTATGEYLRPIVLMQAQPRDKTRSTLTVTELREALTGEFDVREDWIAVEAYGERGLEGIDVNLPECPIRFVLTVQQLREGWDCPFAYVLASVAEQHSATSVEQILGRILRLPDVRRKRDDALNRAYAFVTSTRFRDAAEALVDALVQSGFEALEARDFVRPAEQTVLPDIGPLFAPTRPEALVSSLRVPQLLRRVDGQLELLESEHLLPVDWSLAGADPCLSSAEFPSTESDARDALIDVGAEGRARFEQREFESSLHTQMILTGVEDDWTAAQLAVWLDRRLKDRQDLTQSDTQLFLLRAIEHLREDRGFELADLRSRRYRLLRALQTKIDRLRSEVRGQRFHELLTTDGELEVDPAHCFEIEADRYAPSQLHGGPQQFRKHAFRLIGAMNELELECATILDAHSAVEHWLRNVERRPRDSFWLQTATDRFYPDFVAQLVDGIILAVETKSERDWTNEDSIEKRNVGALWEARSGGACRFIMPSGAEWGELREMLEHARQP